MTEPHRSVWLREALPDFQPCPPLLTDEEADVVIVGGGYVGLWTAWHLSQRRPSARIVVLEGDVCGGGASGRNGGLMLSWANKAVLLEQLFGPDDGARLLRASIEAIDAIETVTQQEAIDCDLRRDGYLRTATTPSQIDSWVGAAGAAERLGVHAFEPLSAQQIAGRIGPGAHLAGVFERAAATVHPARLVLGLRDAVRRRGVQVYERSRVTRTDRRHPVRVKTEHGTVVTADRLVIATNAWAVTEPELRHRMFVVASSIIATAPAPEALRQQGWTGGEGVADSQLRLHYYRTTSDGRVIFGRGGGRVARLGRMGRRLDRDDGQARELQADLRRILPGFARVPLDDHWSGPVDRTANGLPVIGPLGSRRHVLAGVGWSGSGVAESYVGGRILAGLLADEDDEWTSSPLIGLHTGRVAPEPLRTVGAGLVRGAVARAERADILGRRVSPADRVLMRFVPGSLASRAHPSGGHAIDHRGGRGA